MHIKVFSHCWFKDNKKYGHVVCLLLCDLTTGNWVQVPFSLWVLYLVSWHITWNKTHPVLLPQNFPQAKHKRRKWNHIWPQQQFRCRWEFSRSANSKQHIRTFSCSTAYLIVTFCLMLLLYYLAMSDDGWNNDVWFNLKTLTTYSWTFKDVQFGWLGD